MTAFNSKQELVDTEEIGDYLVRHKESTYLLQVVGDSMREFGICSKDMVLFERRFDAKYGDIVVSLTPDGYVLSHMQNKKVDIIGVVTATFRTYV